MRVGLWPSPYPTAWARSDKESDEQEPRIAVAQQREGLQVHARRRRHRHVVGRRRTLSNRDARHTWRRGSTIGRVLIAIARMRGRAHLGQPEATRAAHNRAGRQIPARTPQPARNGGPRPMRILASVGNVAAATKRQAGHAEGLFARRGNRSALRTSGALLLIEKLCSAAPYGPLGVAGNKPPRYKKI